MSVSLAVEPRLLEQLLEALSALPFPVNPQIYHNALVARLYPDGHSETEPATFVGFPAYASRLAQIRDALSAAGFDPESAWANNMLAQIHSECESGPAPPGAQYTGILRYRRLLTVV